MNKLISIIGNTGVGKTTLVSSLCQAAGFTSGLEQHTERPFQALFKQDARYALANQIDYLLLRAEQERVLRKAALPGITDGGLDQDFHIFTQLFRARGTLSDAEFGLCERLYRQIRIDLPTPDLLIYLHASPDVIRGRLAQRNRINIATVDDISLIETLLGTWAASLPPKQLLRLDVSSVSPSYAEVLPALLDEIHRRLAF